MLIVVKMGGSIVDEDLSEIVLDAKNILQENEIILVHGGGKEVTEMASRLGKKQEFVVSPEGFRSRYTDKETIEIYTMVMTGRINKQIVMSLQRQGVNAIGLSGLDGLLMRAERKSRIIIVDDVGRKRVIDGGYTGKINQVKADLLHLLMSSGYSPVISPVAMGMEFEPLNIDGDRAAAHVAGAVKADRLVLLTDVEGLILNGELMPRLTVSKAKSSLCKIGKGMITKVYAAIEALDMGVGEVLISSGIRRFPISSPLKHECGTVINQNEI